MNLTLPRCSPLPPVRRLHELPTDHLQHHLHPGGVRLQRSTTGDFPLQPGQGEEAVVLAQGQRHSLPVLVQDVEVGGSLNVLSTHDFICNCDIWVERTLYHWKLKTFENFQKNQFFTVKWGL